MIRRNVLIFHQAALGDFIVTWPIAMALSRILAQSRIIYVTHSQKGALAERVLRVESSDIEAGWHTLLASPAGALPERSARLLDGAQTIVTFTAGSEDLFAKALSAAAPHARIISLDTKSTTGAGHITQSLAEQARSNWTPLAEATLQMLRSVESRGTGFALSPKEQIVIHPGAGKEPNRWPAERFLNLVQRLREQGRNASVLLGEVEIDRWPASLVANFEAICEVHRPATLLELLDKVSAAKVFIGNDSGPAHLAGIIGVPTISLFGSSDPSRWRPLGPRVKVLQSNPIEAIEVEQVYNEIGNLMGG